MMRVADITEKNLLDVFRICSFGRLDNEIQLKGVQIKRRWLRTMMDKYGSCTKIAYIDSTPVAQILFYPEEAVPYMPFKRQGVIIIHCTYNPFPRAQRKGIATALVESVLADCRMGTRMLEGNKCQFVVAKPFETGEGLSLDKFFSSLGFIQGLNEMYREIYGQYIANDLTRYTPLYEDRGKAVILYEPLCEWGYVHTEMIKDTIEEMLPGFPVEAYNIWETPEESVKRGNKRLIVNAREIKSPITQKKAFIEEVMTALEVM
jgi:hypothetical protein